MPNPHAPVVAVTSDLQQVDDQQRYTVNVIPVNTLARVLGVVPLVVPPLADMLDLDALLARVDGVMVTGGLTNVSPARYGRTPSDDDGPFDRARDATTLPLIRAAIARGTPILLTCRGLQELNVALGGSLRQENPHRPEHRKHGTPASARTDDDRYRIRQDLDLVPAGRLATILGSEHARVNSLHSQLVDDLAPGLVVEATAPDGSIEAVTVADAPGYVLGVIFHPEYWAERDPTSLAILRSFGEAVSVYRAAGGAAPWAATGPGRGPAR
ncbi:gamma-glutamyl-gamma-aminobutyrate hydrolase family protein [Rhodoplanes roseus]|uniref:Uncharacterized protein n=1 Tax=Rhodoplanes roseus TaxID=29409 RepID=A0A327L3I0_9BRAD|nr:gamma-glutamyl-gamma-aminobutyrate hydrolase family protein [Rhodoplanes roseus]RAI44383.1 hypothetical protein CH341_09520 [Rhodoplanes roseus]